MPVIGLLYKFNGHLKQVCHNFVYVYVLFVMFLLVLYALFHFCLFVVCWIVSIQCGECVR